MYDKSPMRARLSGLPVEYALLQVYSRDAGQRSATIGFDVGQGTQDIGFRNDLDVVFTALPVHHVRVRVRDEHGRPTTAAFLIHDALGRVYPNVSKRLAPDFFFQPQVYRADGSTIDLPSGSFTLSCRAVRNTSRRPTHVEVPRTRGALVHAGALDRPCEPGLVLRRSSHPRGRLLALRESDRRRAAAGHVAADRRRGAERGVRADVGAVVLLPEAVLHRARPSAVDADAIDALRPRGLRLSLEPRRPPRAARA